MLPSLPLSLSLSISLCVCNFRLSVTDVTPNAAEKLSFRFDDINLPNEPAPPVARRLTFCLVYHLNSVCWSLGKLNNRVCV